MVNPTTSSPAPAETPAEQSPSRRDFIQKASAAVVGVAIGLEGASMSVGAQETVADKKKIDLKPGDMLPDLELTDLNGKPLKLSELGKGKVVLVDFWATNCGPCIVERPHMQSTYQALKGKSFADPETGKRLGDGFEIYSVTVHVEESQQQDLRNLLNRFKNRGTALTYPGQVESMDYFGTMDRFGLRGTPQSFLIDSEGRIISKNHDIKSLPLGMLKYIREAEKQDEKAGS